MNTRRALLTGAFHPALEDALLSDLASRVRRDPIGPAVVAVPTNLLGLRLSRLLAGRLASARPDRAAPGGHANVRFMTLKDLAARHAPAPLAGGRALLPAGGDEIALRRVVDAGAADGGHFQPIAGRPGFAAALLATIGDLKEACYTPEALEAAAASAGLIRRGRRGKVAEVARLWRLFEAFLEEEGWADGHDLMAAAVSGIEGVRAGALPPFFLYGFYDLNALQKRLVAAACAAADSRVYVPYLEIPSFRYAEPTLRWFESLGFERTPVGPAGGRETPLPEVTRLISAPGEAREVRENVRTLVALLEKHGLSFQDVGVLLRSPDPYADRFSEELLRVGAGPYVESPCPLARTRSGRSLLKLADAVASGFGRIELMEFLSVADLADDAPVSDWNKAGLLVGIISEAREWVPALEALAARIETARPGGSFRAEHGHLAGPIASLVALLRGLIPPLAALPPRAAPGAFLDVLETTLVRLTKDDGRAAVLDAADDLRTLSPVTGSVSFAEFAELLRSTLDRPGPRSVRFGVGGPSVLSLMSARGLSFRAVVVPGLVEKVFPLHGKQDPILLDTERSALNEARGNDPLNSFPDRAAGAEEEDLLFHLAVAAATDVLVLSWPRLDPATARPRVPSRFALQAAGEIGAGPLNYDDLDRSAHVRRIPLARRFPDERSDALTRAEFDGCSVLEALRTGDPAEVAYLVQEQGPLRAGLAMEAARFGSPFFTAYDGATVSREAADAVRELAGLSREGSPADVAIAATSLEDYARCPFSFFMRRVLRIEPLEEPEDAAAPTPLERGELYHAVLDTFLKRARKEGRTRLSHGDLAALLGTAEEIVASGRWTFAARAGSRDLELLALRRNLALWLWSEVTADSPLRPAYFEARFGGPARPDEDAELSLGAPVPFEAAGGVRVGFSGKIDRIDIDPKSRAAMVIDYKTGSPDPGADALFDRGRKLQLPVYILAAQAMLDAAGVAGRVESAEYRYVTRADRREARSLSRESLDASFGDFGRAIGYILKGIADGMFFPWPEENRCDSCDYRSACGTHSVVLALARMKQGDRRARFFTEGLAGIA
jgi:ATP-dependent helicase/nuclease subunit B